MDIVQKKKKNVEKKRLKKRDISKRKNKNPKKGGKRKEKGKEGKKNKRQSKTNTWFCFPLQSKFCFDLNYYNIFIIVQFFYYYIK